MQGPVDEPDLSPPDASWRPVRVPERYGEGTSYVHGEPRGDRIRVRYYEAPDGGMAAVAWFGPGCEGPPGYAHGGATAALLDEVTGGCAWLAGHPVVAISLQVDFRQRVPLRHVLIARGRVGGQEGRKLTATGELLGPGDELLASARNLLVELDLGQFGGKLARMEDAPWQREDPDRLP